MERSLAHSSPSSHARGAELLRKVPTFLAARRRLSALGAARDIGRGTWWHHDRDRLRRAGVGAIARATGRVEAHDVGEGVVGRDGLSEVEINLKLAVVKIPVTLAIAAIIKALARVAIFTFLALRWCRTTNILPNVRTATQRVPVVRTDHELAPWAGPASRSRRRTAPSPVAPSRPRHSTWR